MVASPASGPDRRLREGAGDGLHALRGLGARVLPLQGELRRGMGEGLQGPHPDHPLHPRLPHPRHHDGRGRTSAQIRRGMQGAGYPGRVLQGRGLVRPARGQLPLRGRGHRRGPPHDLQERRQGDRFPQRDLRELHGEALRGRHRQLLPSSTRAWSARTARASSWTTRARRPTRSMHFLGGMRNHIRDLALFVAPAVNSYKRYAAESWAPTSVSWGRDNRTCGFRVVGPRPIAPGRVPDPRRRRQPVPGLRGPAGRRSGRDRERDGPRARAQGQRLRSRRGRGASRPPSARRSTSGGRATSRRRRSASRSTSTT